MRRKFGTFCMICGLLLLLASAALVVHNQREEDQAADASQEMLLQIQEQMAQIVQANQSAYEQHAGDELPETGLLIADPSSPEAISDDVGQAPSSPDEADTGTPTGTTTGTTTGTGTETGGGGQSGGYYLNFDYLGYVSIPALSLELPVISQWSAYGAQFAPCRHGGAVETDDLVIAGHNFQHHFGRLKELQAGDLITITQMDGTVTVYQVAELKTVKGDDVEAVQNTEWALILYTCTYGGQNRVLVCCNRI